MTCLVHLLVYTMIPFFSRKASRHGRTCWLCPNIVYIHEATAVSYQTKRRTSESTRQKKAVSGGKRNQENAAEAHILLGETTIQLVTMKPRLVRLRQWRWQHRLPLALHVIPKMEPFFRATWIRPSQLNCLFGVDRPTQILHDRRKILNLN